MTFNWFKIFNKTEFLATGLVSRNYKLNMEGVGQKDCLVTLGNLVGLTYEGIFLTLVEGENPFIFEGHALYIDANNDVSLGIAIDEN